MLSHDHSALCYTAQGDLDLQVTRSAKLMLKRIAKCNPRANKTSIVVVVLIMDILTTNGAATKVDIHY